MRNMAVIDGRFEVNMTSTYHLSIQYGQQNISFAILDKTANKYLAYKSIWSEQPVPESHIADHIRTILNSENYLTRGYQSISLIYQTPVSVLVPTPLFNSENPGIYLKHSAPEESECQVLFDKIPSIDAFVAFRVPTDLIRQTSFMLQNIRIFHQSSPQIDFAVMASRQQKEAASVFVYVNPGSADILVTKAGKLLFYNSFTLNMAEDLAFFVLYLFEQFGLSQEETITTLAGFPEIYEGSPDLLRKYIRQVEFATLPATFNYSDVFSGIPPHQLHSLINLARCE